MEGARLIVFLLVVVCLIGVVVLLASAECRVEVESNDTATEADGLGPLPASPCRRGAILPAGDVDMYWFEVADPADVVIETRTDGDTILVLYDADGERLAEDDDGGSGRASRLAGRLEAGMYFLALSAYGSNVVPSYEIWIEATVPSSYTADPSCPPEVEANDTTGQADRLPANGGVACRSGSVFPAGDVDVYSLDLASATRIVIETESDGDTVLRLYDAEGDLLVSDDDGGEGKASRIAGIAQAGRYYVTVREYGDDAAIPTYRVFLTVEPSPAGPGGPSTTTPPPPPAGVASGPTPPWGWSIYGGGVVLSAYGAIDRDCPSDYDFNMGLCDKKTYTFTLGSPGFLALALIDQAGEWITVYVYDAGHQRVAAKLGVSRPIYSEWTELPAGTYTVEVVPGKRLDNSPYELHVFFSTTRPDPGYLVRTYGSAERELPG